MPARPPREKVTTATRSPRGPVERLTLSGAPMPRTTSHSVCPSATVPEVEGRAQAPVRNPQIIINCAMSLFPPLPAPPVIGLPVGNLEAARLAILPGIPRRRQRIAIVAVENQHEALVALGVRRQRRVINQET